MSDDRKLPVVVVTEVIPVIDSALLKERQRVYEARQEEADGGLVKAAIEAARRIAGVQGRKI